MLKKMLLISLLTAGTGMSAFAQVEKPNPTVPPTAAQPTATVVAEKSQRNFWVQLSRDIALYIPNRILDLTNVFTIKLNAGAPVAAKVKLTEFARIGGSHGASYFVESGYHSQYGAAYKNGTEFAFWPWAYSNYYVEDSAGTIKEFTLQQDFGLTKPSLYPYEQDFIDLWGIGAEAGCFVTVHAEVHLKMVPNLVAGFFFLNINGDDLK